CAAGLDSDNATDAAARRGRRLGGYAGVCGTRAVGPATGRACGHLVGRVRLRADVLLCTVGHAAAGRPGEEHTPGKLAVTAKRLHGADTGVPPARLRRRPGASEKPLTPLPRSQAEPGNEVGSGFAGRAWERGSRRRDGDRTGGDAGAHS